MYHTYKDRAAFFLVYIREAHPDSVLHTLIDGKETLVKIKQTETTAERADTARKCVATLNLSMPTLIDREDNRVNFAYAAWPDRLCIVGVDGRVAYLGGPGPRGFKVAEVVEWLAKEARKPPLPSSGN